MEASALRQDGEDVILRVRAKPRASKSRFVEERGGEWDVALAAPPVDGSANAELVKFLSRALGLPKSRVSLERGETSRHKVVRLSSVRAEEVRASIGG